MSLQKILYVEDDPDIQMVARMALETVGGFTLEACLSGQEALDKAVGFQPDLLLLDVQMPGMDGVTTLQALRKLPGFADVPAIFMTAKVMPSDIQHYRECGALDVIPKPFNPMELAVQVRAVWETANG